MKKIILIAVLSVFTMSAFAQFPVNRSYKIQHASGFVMNLENGKTDGGANVNLWSSNGSNAQSWRLIKADGEDTYYVMNPEGAHFIDYRDGFKRGKSIVIWWTHCRESQKYVITPAGDGYYYIKALEGDLYLAPQYSDVKAGTNVVLWDKSDNARWLLN